MLLFRCGWPLAVTRLGVVYSCRHTLGSTRLTHISSSTSVSSVRVLLSVCVAVVNLVVSLSISVLIVVCGAGSVCGLSVFELFLSTTVDFDVELSPEMIF